MIQSWNETTHEVLTAILTARQGEVSETSDIPDKLTSRLSLEDDKIAFLNEVLSRDVFNRILSKDMVRYSLVETTRFQLSMQFDLGNRVTDEELGLALLDLSTNVQRSIDKEVFERLPYLTVKQPWKYGHDLGLMVLDAVRRCVRPLIVLSPDGLEKLELLYERHNLSTELIGNQQWLCHPVIRAEMIISEMVTGNRIFVLSRGAVSCRIYKFLIDLFYSTLYRLDIEGELEIVSPERFCIEFGDANDGEERI